jgi:tRNA(Ile)-lysidine synthase
MVSTADPELNSDTSRLTRIVEEALLSGGVDRRSHLLLALSGGPDSTALLFLLGRYLRSVPGRLTAAYFNHGLQPEAEQKTEVKVLRANCDTLEIPLIAEGLEPGDLARAPEAKERGLEAAAREVRYAFLYRTAERIGATHLLTAHHREDQLETILMRLLTGSGLPALRGIDSGRDTVLPSGRSLRILRPFLGYGEGADGAPGGGGFGKGVRPDELRAFLRAEGVRWHTDRSNRSERFLRNRIRQRLVPLLKELVPDYSRSLLRLAEEAREVGDALEGAAGKLPVRIEGAEIRFPGDSFWAVSGSIRRRAVLAAVNRVIPEVQRLPERFLRPLWGASTEGRETGHGVEVVYDAAEIRIRPLVVRPDKKGYFSVVWGGSCPPPVKLRVTLSGAETRCTDFECPGLVPPLVLRTRRSGDRLDRSDGSIRLNRLLSTAEVPTGRRDAVPLLEDRQGIVAVVSLGGTGDVHLSERCHAVDDGRQTPDMLVNISENGIKVEYAKRQQPG